MGVNADNATTKLVQHKLPLTGSKITVYENSLAQSGTPAFSDLVASGGSAISGKGELLAIGYRRGAAASTNRLDEIKTTIDGGSAQTMTSLGDTSSIFGDNSGATGADSMHTHWVPWNIPFNTSIKVETKATAGALGGSVLTFAVVRWVI